MHARALLEQTRLPGIDSRVDRGHAPAHRAAARMHRSAGVVTVRSLVVCSLVGSLLVFSGCRGPEQRYTSLGAGAATLKQQFNADAGKTRILILPAPN